ncbi:GFA family protein [Methylocystis heyeri]|uniref:CENP-V/GFA domain-containing protein n=1 Tax=Methylocystis heyeri TaxID=391905 RepID=A0A6B8KDZ1_9HYPH|nr:hypothetical protein [Methylocystis heyeri]QGM45919.1 hypothetical protein H2LOC_009500 [Methylocystis heyeri]
MTPTIRTYSCACGRVKCEAVGAPILSAVCYCADCQEGGRRIEALPGAAPVRDPDGGTPYLTYRDDRFRCLAGEELLTDYRLKPRSPTRRVVASCCDSGMYLKFDPGFWVSTYRLRYEGELPPIEMRTNARRRNPEYATPTDAPSYPGFPLGLFWRLASARIAMLLGR